MGREKCLGCHMETIAMNVTMMRDVMCGLS